MSVSPPSIRFPSLTALRSFEAAARLGGFALAAEELRVTPGAVAAQIKALEEDIGAPLFERNARGVRLTALGQRVLPEFVAAFDALGQAVRELRSAARPGRIQIAALPALAQLWLAPRLPALRARFPDLDISVTAMEQPPNLKRAPYDLCLFYAETPPPGAVVLAQDALLPVCASDLAARVTAPADLERMTCLSDAVWSEDWAIWAAEAAPGVKVPNGPVYSLYALAVDQALCGAGVLMGHRALVAHHLASGALVAPLDLAVPLRQAALAWVPPGGRARAEVVALRDALAAPADQLA